LGWLCDMAVSHDVAVLEDVPKDVHKLAGRIVQKWWKPHGMREALHRLEEARAKTVSDCSY
jgi:2-polyprenyl-3-methyl-5-hydroxy-6-metoxy-1,4-benzoquinol methylase